MLPEPYALIVNSGRTGEMRQCAEFARALNICSELVDPFSHPFREPVCILSFGSMYSIAAEIWKSFGKRPVFVQFGRPRHVPVRDIDLIITMPQDEFPHADNIINLAMPLNGASMKRRFIEPAPVVQEGTTTVLLGGPTPHFHFDERAALDLLDHARTLAGRNEERLVLAPSPRTPSAIHAVLSRALNPISETWDDRPCQEILSASNRVVVTSDSASMLAESWRSGKPTWLYRLPSRTSASGYVKRLVDRLCGKDARYRLITHGLLAGGTDFASWHESLLAKRHIRCLEDSITDPFWRPTNIMPDFDLAQCVQTFEGIRATGTTFIARKARHGYNPSLYRMRSQ